MVQTLLPAAGVYHSNTVLFDIPPDTNHLHYPRPSLLFATSRLVTCHHDSPQCFSSGICNFRFHVRTFYVGKNSEIDRRRHQLVTASQRILSVTWWARSQVSS